MTAVKFYVDVIFTDNLFNLQSPLQIKTLWKSHNYSLEFWFFLRNRIFPFINDKPYDRD